MPNEVPKFVQRVADYFRALYTCQPRRIARRENTKAKMSDQQWVEIGSEEAAVAPKPFAKFKQLGDAVQGKYLGTETVPQTLPGRSGTKEVYRLLTVDPRDTGKALEILVDPNPDLKKRMSVARVGDILRITRVGEMNVNQPSPMIVFKVERAPAGTVPATPAAQTPTQSTKAPF
jgi:hypothetical protein